MQLIFVVKYFYILRCSTFGLIVFPMAFGMIEEDLDPLWNQKY